MLRTHLFTKDGVREDVPLEEWRTLVEGECSLLWVDARSYTDDEFRELAARFGFHEVAVRSSVDGYRRPHLYEFEDHFYVNLTTLQDPDHGQRIPKPSELHLFAGEKFIVTATRDEGSDAVDRAMEEFAQAPRRCDRSSIYAVFLLADDLVETYFPVVERLDEDADRLEDVMLARADQSSLRRLTSLKRRGFELRRLLGPQRDVFNELARRDFPFLQGENRVYFQDVYSRMIRLFDMMDTIREILSGSLDIYLSTVSNRLNEIVKVLTIAATILMTLGLIASFFGMNFVHLPWLRSPNAFRNSLIAMVTITAGMLWWFRRKGWL